MIKRLAGHGGARLRGTGGAARVGRGVTYTLRRLKRDRPDLLKRVVSGELSATRRRRRGGISQAADRAGADADTLAEAQPGRTESASGLYERHRSIGIRQVEPDQPVPC